MNENIKSYLDHYFQIQKPSFAVLIKGNWGSGKTWFLKKYISEFVSHHQSLDPTYKSPFLFVSLYGVTSTVEIDEKLFEQLHPVLGSTAVKVGSKVLQNIFKLGVTASVAGADISGTLPEINVKSIFANFDDKIIVFDDLERSNLNLRTLFGYINNFVELKNQRTVILANEDEISDKDLFKKTQEKIIGKLFYLSPNVHEAIEAFFSEITEEQLKTIFSNLRLQLVELFLKVGKSNLRNFRQAILHFEYFYKLIGHPYNQNTDFVSELVIPFFCIGLQYKNGEVDEGNWKTALSGYLRHKMTVLEYASSLQDQSHRSEAMYGDLYLAENVPLIDLWPDLIIKGNYDGARIKSSISNAKYFVDEKIDPLRKLMRTFRGMSSKEFSETVDLVIDRFQLGEYTHPGDILHIFDLLSLFSKWGLIKYSVPTLKKIVIGQVEKMKLDNKIEAVDLHSHSFSHFGGYSFSTRESKEFKDVFSRIDKITSDKREAILRADIKATLDSMPESFLQFCRDLCTHEGDAKYSNTPVLSLVDPKVFSEKYFLVPHDLISSFEYALRDRYELKYSNGILRDEFDSEYGFIKKFVSIIQGKIMSEGVLNKPFVFALKENLEELKKVKSRFDLKLGKSVASNTDKSPP